MSDAMHFNEIADTGKTVILKRTASDGTDEDDHTRKSKDRPHPDFVDALQAFGGVLRKLLKLPKEWQIDVRKVTVNYDSETDKPESVVITGVHEIEGSNRPFNVNSPLLDLDMHTKLDAYVDVLNEEAELFYLRKKRVDAQIEMEDRPAGGLTEDQQARAAADWPDAEDTSESESELVGAES